MAKDGNGSFDAKLAHLDMIQAIVNRLSSNAFVFKGWAATVIAGISAFAAKDTSRRIMLVALLATILFWLSDAYYLSLERRYRDLYDHVAKVPEDKIDFSMKLLDNHKYRAWLKAMYSEILIVFYGLAAVLIIVAYWLIRRH
jgi:uncharacterized membrane protein YozB (DUF420 family)